MLKSFEKAILINTQNLQLQTPNLNNSKKANLKFMLNVKLKTEREVKT